MKYWYRLLRYLKIPFCKHRERGYLRTDKGWCEMCEDCAKSFGVVPMDDIDPLLRPYIMEANKQKWEQG